MAKRVRKKTAGVKKKTKKSAVNKTAVGKRPPREPRPVRRRYRSHETCPICKKIPAICYDFWTSEESKIGIPPEAEKLEVVGAPHVRPHTGGGNTVYKQCPLCETVYRWKFTYEFLVPMSEDEVELTRLSTSEGKSAIKETWAGIRGARARFKREIERDLDQLRLARPVPVARRAAFELYYGLGKGFDVRFALPAMVEGIARHRHGETTCSVGMYLEWALERYIGDSRRRAGEVLKLLEARRPKRAPPELKRIQALCKRRIGR